MNWPDFISLFSPAETWTSGPDLPHEIRFPGSVEYEGGLLLVGGLCPSCPDSSLYLNTIYEYNPQKGVNGWSLRIEHSVTSAEAMAAVIVDNSKVECL